MNGRMIPEAAVEAAANDLHDREGYSTSLADAPQYRKDRFRTLAREVLQAAAPHMLAEAWGRGNRAALGRPNPYAAEQFLAAYAARSGVGRERALDGRVVSTCTCGDEECEGFQLIPENCVLEWRGETVLIRGATK